MKVKLKKGYVVPTSVRIDRTAASEKLYDIEERISDLLRQAAKQQSEILDIPIKSFWEQAVPLQLFSLLNSFQTWSAVPAAVGYLRSQGYTIEVEEDE